MYPIRTIPYTRHLEARPGDTTYLIDLFKEEFAPEIHARMSRKILLLPSEAYVHTEWHVDKLQEATETEPVLIHKRLYFEISFFCACKKVLEVRAIQQGSGYTMPDEATLIRGPVDFEEFIEQKNALALA